MGNKIPYIIGGAVVVGSILWLLSKKKEEPCGGLCEPDEICVNNECMHLPEPQCQNNDDCPEGVCTNGLCTPLFFPPICEEGDIFVNRFNIGCDGLVHFVTYNCINGRWVGNPDLNECTNDLDCGVVNGCDTPRRCITDEFENRCCICLR